MADKIGGPFLSMAIFCERVLQEKDGVLSAIRITDRFIHTLTGQNVPDKMLPLKIQMAMLLGFKSGDVKGKWELKIYTNTPSGQRLPTITITIPIVFEGGEKGSNININIAFEAKEEGLYWFDIILNDKPLTKMPLSVIYQKMQTASGTPETLQKSPL